MKKILVVDDDPSLLALVRSFLREKYEVVVFASGNTALDVLEKIKPDLILTDVLMPEMNGYEFFVNLQRSDSLFRDTPLIVMSTREHLKFLFDERGMISFLPKPFSKTEIVMAIEDALTHGN